MEARAVKKYERHQRKDGIFGKVVVEDCHRPAWRVEVKIGKDLYFTSNRKYASEASAKAAAKRIVERRG